MFDIVSVTMENFRSYRGHHSFAFPNVDGVFSLTGDNRQNRRLGANGVGKSSLLDAIHWCLFGKSTRGLKASDVVTWGEKSCLVQLELLLADTTHVVTRQQAPNNLTIDGETVDQGKVEALLRLTSDQFLRSIILPQFGEAFFDLQPAAKLGLFSQIMGLDFWLEKSRGAATLADTLSADKHRLELDLATTKGRTESAEADLPPLREQASSFVNVADTNVKKLEINLRQQMKDQTKLEGELKAAKQALLNAETRLVNHAAKSKALQTCKECGQPLPAARQVADIEREVLVRNRDDFKGKVSKIEWSIDTFKSNIKLIKIDIDKEMKRENPYERLIADKTKAIRNLKTQTVELQKKAEQVANDHAAVSYWVGGFKRVRLMLIDEALCQLEVEINNNLTGLGLVDWRVELDVERENKSGGVTKGFTVLVWAPNHEAPVRWEAWSGGETQRLRLAGDFGLANLIMERAGLTSRIEFIDEPSQHLSQEGLLDLAETLYQRAQAMHRRVWLVDHRAIDFADFAGVLTVTKGPQGSSLKYHG